MRKRLKTIGTMKSNSRYVELPKEAIKAQNFDDIKKAKRLFFHEVNMKTPTGKWIEIYDVSRFIEQEKDHQEKGIKGNCSIKSYIDHHNFHITN